MIVETPSSLNDLSSPKHNWGTIRTQNEADFACSQARIASAYMAQREVPVLARLKEWEVNTKDAAGLPRRFKETLVIATNDGVYSAVYTPPAPNLTLIFTEVQRGDSTNSLPVASPRAENDIHFQLCNPLPR